MANNPPVFFQIDEILLALLFAAYACGLYWREG